jgi:uncharacterized protein YjbI with pentapeptide repeats
MGVTLSRYLAANPSECDILPLIDPIRYAHSGALASHSWAVALESADDPQKSSETQSGHAPRFRPESVWVAALLASSAAVLLGLAIYLALHLVVLKGVAPNEVVKTTLTLMAALAAVLTGVYAYRKQRLSEADGRRADADQTRADGEQLTQRYSTAAEQLGHDKAAVRLAGVFAMARLADDWPKQRQQSIDVLCAYLRMPAEHDDDLSEREVRATIVRTITAHLLEDSAIKWVENDLDFTGAALHDAIFEGATFSGESTSFAGARFSGNTSFFGARFSGRDTNFREATFSGEHTWFAGARFSAKNTAFFGATFSGGETNFHDATFSGGYTMFVGTTFSGQSTNFFGATFAGQNTSFAGATFSGGYTNFIGATFSAENTNFIRATFSGGTPADAATEGSSFVGTTVSWGPITPRTLPSPAPVRHTGIST